MKPLPIHTNAMLRAVAAAVLGIILLLVSQTFSEKLSRVGPYPDNADISVMLPGDEGASLETAERLQPEYTPVPAYIFDDPERSGPGIFEINFEWRTGDPQPALLLAYFRRLDAIDLNGHPVAIQNLRQQSMFSAWRPVAVQLDETHLRDGANQLRVTDPGRSRKVMPAFSIVPADEAQTAAFAGEFFELHLALAVTGIMLFVALFCSFVSWPTTEKLQIRCFIALLLVWSLRNAMGFDLFGEVPSPWRVFIAYWIGYVLAAAYAAYCFAWAGKGLHWIVSAWSAAGAAILLTLALGYESGGAAFEISYLVESWLIPALVALGIVMICLGEARSGTTRPVQLMLIAGAGAALALDALDERFDLSLGLFDPQPMIYYATPRHGLLLAMGIFGAMVFHQIRARRLSEDLTGELNRRLDQREAELEEVHTREKLWVRQQAFGEERQRIMRDMHDGLGSQLMGMLLAARRGKAEPDKVAEGLQQVIDELRLMIDSMDSVGESLGAALAALRTRLQPRVEDAGFAFAWNNQLAGKLPSYPPRKTLQLFRIMQEAVTNALKHSGGTCIAITLEHAADQEGWLLVTVSDNGSGIKGPRIGGHGLENMRARAAQVGGTVSYDDPADGGTVRIAFPPSAPRARNDA